MSDPTDIERIRTEVRHGFTYTLPRTALNDVETLLGYYDIEKQRRQRYQATLQNICAWARRSDNQGLLSLLTQDLEDIYAEE